MANPTTPYDIEVVRTAIGFARVHVSDAPNLHAAQVMAVEMAHDMVIPTTSASCEPVNGWAPDPSFTLLVLPNFLDSEDFDGEMPVACAVRISPEQATQIASASGKTRLDLQPDAYRWLHAIAFTSEGGLAPIPGFYAGTGERVVFLGDVENIDYDANNETDPFEETCTLAAGQVTSCSLAIQHAQHALHKPLCLHVSSDYVSSDGNRPITLHSSITPVNEVVEKVGRPTLIQHNSASRYTQGILSSNAMMLTLIQASELESRKEGETAIAWLTRMAHADFAQGRDGCLFPRLHKECAPHQHAGADEDSGEEQPDTTAPAP